MSVYGYDDWWLECEALDDEPPPDWELPFEPPYDHPAAAFPGESGEPARSDGEVPYDTI